MSQQRFFLAYTIYKLQYNSKYQDALHPLPFLKCAFLVAIFHSLFKTFAFPLIPGRWRQFTQRDFFHRHRRRANPQPALLLRASAAAPAETSLPPPTSAEHRPVLLPSQTQLDMDNSGKEKEAMQLMAEADKKVKASGSFLGGMFG